MFGAEEAGDDARRDSGRLPGIPAAPPLAVISEVMHSRGVRVELHQRTDGSGKFVIEFDDAQVRDAVLERLGTLDR